MEEKCERTKLVWDYEKLFDETVNGDILEDKIGMELL